MIFQDWQFYNHCSENTFMFLSTISLKIQKNKIKAKISNFSLACRKILEFFFKNKYHRWTQTPLISVSTKGGNIIFPVISVSASSFPSIPICWNAYILVLMQPSLKGYLYKKLCRETSSSVLILGYESTDFFELSFVEG